MVLCGVPVLVSLDLEESPESENISTIFSCLELHPSKAEMWKVIRKHVELLMVLIIHLLLAAWLDLSSKLGSSLMTLLQSLLD